MKGWTSEVWISLSDGECSTRDKREILFRCCVSRLLDSEAKAKKGLPAFERVVEKERRLAIAVMGVAVEMARSADGSSRVRSAMLAVGELAKVERRRRHDLIRASRGTVEAA